VHIQLDTLPSPPCDLLHSESQLLLLSTLGQHLVQESKLQLSLLLAVDSLTAVDRRINCIEMKKSGWFIALIDLIATPLGSDSYIMG
jgi:hypothetical protein